MYQYIFDIVQAPSLTFFVGNTSFSIGDVSGDAVWMWARTQGTCPSPLTTKHVPCTWPPRWPQLWVHAGHSVTRSDAPLQRSSVGSTWP